jgi:hypothetical protein
LTLLAQLKLCPFTKPCWREFFIKLGVLQNPAFVLVFVLLHTIALAAERDESDRSNHRLGWNIGYFGDRFTSLPESSSTPIYVQFA